jgi:hypothetical protein
MLSEHLVVYNEKRFCVERISPLKFLEFFLIILQRRKIFLMWRYHWMIVLHPAQNCINMKKTIEQKASFLGIHSSKTVRVCHGEGGLYSRVHLKHFPLFPLAFGSVFQLQNISIIL